jgi:BirA family biotin operon repressor/biotin-[acetyl-CoA-carboxylase] ligase
MGTPQHPWPEGTARIVLEETDSTMNEAARRLSGLDRPTWIAARRQTAARGRRGRTWASPKGAFAATLALPLDAPPAAAALRSFVAALALHDTLNEMLPGALLALKWPNDVLLDGGKVAGILLESGARPGWLLLGIGVNLAGAPAAAALEPGALRPVALSAYTEPPADPVALLTPLAWHVRHYEQLMQEAGFDAIRRLWLARAARLGEEITARTGREEIRGIFETVDGDGQLVLSTEAGRRVIPAAEVYF